jgi:hypothetical protein
MAGQKGAAPAESEQDTRTRQRSTIAFPYMDLDSGIELASAIHTHVGHGECDDDQLAAWSNQSAKSSTFRVQVYAARTFGVLDGEGGKHKLTDLGRSIVDPNQSRGARVRAFLNVQLFKALFDNHRSGVLPPTAALEREIVQLGVSEKQKGRARQVFERAAEQAGFFDHGKNRLVMPGLAPGAPPHKEKDKVGEGNNFGGGGSGGSGGNGSGPQDALIQALIHKLPQSGPWGADERVNWLKLLTMAFQIAYGPTDEIEIKKPQ